MTTSLHIDYSQGCQVSYFDAKFHKFDFFRGSWRQKNCLLFWLFLFNVWLFWRQLAHRPTIRLVFWLLKYQLWSLETWSRSRDVFLDPFLGVSVSKISGLVSVSKDFGLGLDLFVSRLCIGYFLWRFARSSLQKRFLKNDCSKFSCSKRSVATLSLLLHCLRVGENNLPSTPFKIYTVLNKNVHAPMNPQRVISATTGWEYVVIDYLWIVFPRVLLWNPWAYSAELGECHYRWQVTKSIKNFVFEKPNKTMSFFRSAFQSTLLKHAGEVFLVLRNADFFKFKNASDLSWGKVLLMRVLYREKIMRHGWSVTLTYCCSLYGLFAFSNRHAVLRTL